MTQSETKLTRKARRNAPARKHPLDTPELRAEMLRLMREGVTLTEMCARPDMPPLATYFMWKSKDPEFAALINQAMSDHADVIISDAMDQNIAQIDAMEEADLAAAEGKEPVNGSDKNAPARAKSADLYLQAALKYAGAIAPHKYGQLLKVTDAQVGNGIQISITSYAANGSQNGANGPQDTDSAA